MIQELKSVVIEAVQWTGENFDEVSNFTENFHGHKVAYEDAEELAYKTGEYYISNPSGRQIIALKYDWIIKHTNGGFYPCVPADFEKVYKVTA